MSIYFDRAFIHIVETHQKFYHRCFTGSGWTYDRNLLSRLHFHTEIIDDYMIWVISEMYMFKLYAAFQIIDRHGIRNCLFFFLFFQKFKYTLRCGCCRLQHICHLRYLLDRLRKIPYILNKGLDISNFDHAFHCQITAQNNFCHIS